MRKLQHVNDTVSGNIHIKKNPGSNQITAIVRIHKSQKKANLEWGHKDPKTISDILLILTLFTSRNVFLKEWEEKDIVLVQDHRKLSNLSFPEIIHGRYNNGWKEFEKNINLVMENISATSWLEQYSNGYFLFTFRQAIQNQVIETSFTLCFTIWEHIFSLHNNMWMDKKTLLNTSGQDKVAFVLLQYFGIKNDDFKEIVTALVLIRNKLIHFGKKPHHKAPNIKFLNLELDYIDSLLFEFIELTEELIIIILGLTPSKTRDSISNLRELKNNISKILKV